MLWSGSPCIILGSTSLPDSDVEVLSMSDVCGESQALLVFAGFNWMLRVPDLRRVQQQQEMGLLLLFL